MFDLLFFWRGRPGSNAWTCAWMAACGSETSIMSQGTEAADSLSRAIGEFRTELLVWIDTELARLQGGDQEESPVVEERATTPGSIGADRSGGSYPGTRTHSEASRPGGPDLLSGRGRETPRDGEMFAEGSLKAEIPGPALAVPGSETDLHPQADPLNPRQRLEALSRLLDHRLKQVDGAARTSCGATTGRSPEIPDEPPSQSGRPAGPRTSHAD